MVKVPSRQRVLELITELRLYHHYEAAAALEAVALSEFLAKEIPPPVTHVAIKFQGRIWSLPRPYRHHHVLRVIFWLVQEFGEYTNETIKRDVGGGDSQGFLDSTGAYLTRKQAMVVAMANGQITKPGHPTIADTLYSEDVW